MRYLIDILLLSLLHRRAAKKYYATEVTPDDQPYQCTSGYTNSSEEPEQVANNHDEVDLYLVGASYGVVFSSQEVGPLSVLATRYDRGEFCPEQ